MASKAALPVRTKDSSTSKATMLESPTEQTEPATKAPSAPKSQTKSASQKVSRKVPIYLDNASSPRRPASRNSPSRIPTPTATRPAMPKPKEPLPPPSSIQTWSPPPAKTSQTTKSAPTKSPGKKKQQPVIIHHTPNPKNDQSTKHRTKPNPSHRPAAHTTVPSASSSSTPGPTLHLKGYFPQPGEEGYKASKTDYWFTAQHHHLPECECVECRPYLHAGRLAQHEDLRRLSFLLAEDEEEQDEDMMSDGNEHSDSVFGASSSGLGTVTPSSSSAAAPPSKRSHPDATRKKKRRWDVEPVESTGSSARKKHRGDTRASIADSHAVGDDDDDGDATSQATAKTKLPIPKPKKGWKIAAKPHRDLGAYGTRGAGAGSGVAGVSERKEKEKEKENLGQKKTAVKAKGTGKGKEKGKGKAEA